eukprot:6841982-Ditylum_brightwellii.AAC.1
MANQPIKICIHQEGMCQTKTHRRRKFNLLLPDGLYLLMSNQYTYPLTVCFEGQMSNHIFVEIAMSKLSIDQANNLWCMLFQPQQKELITRLRNTL